MRGEAEHKRFKLNKTHSNNDDAIKIHCNVYFY